MQEEAFLREIGRILKPGGQLTLRAPATGALAGFDAFNLSHYLMDLTRHGYRTSETSEIGWRKHYPIADLERLVTNAGLSVTSVERSRFVFAELAGLIVILRHRWWGYDLAAYERGQRRVDWLRRCEDRLKFRGGFLATVIAVKPAAN